MHAAKVTWIIRHNRGATLQRPSELGALFVPSNAG